MKLQSRPPVVDTWDISRVEAIMKHVTEGFCDLGTTEPIVIRLRPALCTLQFLGHVNQCRLYIFQDRVKVHITFPGDLTELSHSFTIFAK